MIAPEFNRLLVEALTPITLISSVGLLMLCMTARYNHATNRIRQLMSKRRAQGAAQEPDIDREITIIFRRAALLRRGTILLASSTVCSSLLIALSAAHAFSGFNYDNIGAFLLIVAIGLIVLASMFFSMEIWISLHALHLVVKRLPPPKDAHWRVPHP